MARKAKANGKPPEPPPPPKMRRQVAFYLTQAIAMPIIVAFPILGLFGVFDSHSATTAAEAGGISLEVVYPSRLRDKSAEPLEIRAANNTGAELPKLEIKLDRKYVDGFDNPQFYPEPKEIDEESLIFEFEGVQPGETRRVSVDVEKNGSGTKEGRVWVEAAGGGPQAKFSTFVYP